MRRLALLGLVAAGCGGHCKDVEHARQALAHDGAQRDADVRVTLPFDRANDVIAGLLAQEPLTLPIDPPDLGPVEIDTTLSAVVRTVKLLPGAADRVRFAIEIAIVDRADEVTQLGAVLEVQPVVTPTELTIGLGPQALVGVTPNIGDSRRLRDAIVRWVPERVKDKVPGFVLDRAVSKLGGELTGHVWNLVRERLGPRIGDVTRVKLRLPDVPIARTAIRSTQRAMVIDLVTDLPVRRGLVSGDDDEIGVRLSGSTVAELANWAIDQGHAPRWYNRTIEPREDGKFRPRFDYVAEASHPLKVYSFQERGGCSYFRVGVKPAVSIAGDQLKGTVLDRDLEKKAANPVIETLAWTKYFLIGWLDRSKKVAGHTRLTIGKRTLETRVTRAGIVDHEVRFGLQFDAGTAPR